MRIPKPSLRSHAAPARRDRQGGAVLVIVMLAIIGLLGIGLAGVFLTGGNVQMAANTNIRNQALYVAEAGLERARDILNGPAQIDFASMLGGLGHAAHPADELPQAPLDSRGQPVGRGAILRDAAGVPLYQITYPTSVSRIEAIPVDNPNGAPNTYMGSYTVYVRNDTPECRMGFYRTDGGNQMVVVRSEGVGFDNRTTVVLEVVMGPKGGGATSQSGAGGVNQVLCNSGKNSCDDNNSVINNVVVN
ncbi:MAG TPA: pilus assembly PilX N-terminal domain-containing protein [Polyangia bacterium]